MFEHAMKVVGRVLEKRIQETVEIRKIQMVFKLGKDTVNSMQDIWKNLKKWHFALVDLEEAFDCVF